VSGASFGFLLKVTEVFHLHKAAIHLPLNERSVLRIRSSKRPRAPVSAAVPAPANSSIAACLSAALAGVTAVADYSEVMGRNAQCEAVRLLAGLFCYAFLWA
jgi:hypothetical protein